MYKKDLMGRRVTDYFVLFFLISISGIQYFSGSNSLQITLFALTTYLFIRRRIKVDIKAILILFLFLFIELIQFYIHGGSSLNTSFGTIVKLGMAYLIVKLLNKKFVLYYINIIYLLSIISLIFYTLSFVPGFNNFIIKSFTQYFISPFRQVESFYASSPSIIIFTFNEHLLHSFRNSGPFYEPGAFAVFLNIALLFSIILYQKFNSKKSIIFVISILTTLSTAGYLALFVIIGGYFGLKKGITTKIFFVLFIPVALFIFISTPFMQKKIIHNIEVAKETTSSRFGSALADYELFKKSPVVGWGRGEMRHGGGKYLYFGQNEHRNNGVFSLLASYGLIIFLFYFILIYLNFYKLCSFFNFSSEFALISLIVIIILAFSQNIFVRPFTYTFLFFFLFNNKNNLSKDKSQNKLVKH